MQRIIIDTNVLISALIQKSYPNFILFHCVLENRFEVCISDELLEEYLEVINRPKFSKYPDSLIKAELVISQIESIASKYYPRDRFETIADKADNRLLEYGLKPNKQQKQQPNNYPVVSEIFESVVFDQFDKDLYRCPG